MILTLELGESDRRLVACWIDGHATTREATRGECWQYLDAALVAQGYLARLCADQDVLPNADNDREYGVWGDDEQFDPKIDYWGNQDLRDWARLTNANIYPQQKGEIDK